MEMIGDPGKIRRGKTALDLLVLLPSTSVGGAEKHTLDLCEAFAAAGMRVTLLTTADCLGHVAVRAAALEKIPGPVEWRDDETFEGNVRRQKHGVEQVLAARGFDCAIVCAPWPHYAFGLQKALAEHGAPHLTVAHLFPRPETPEWSRLPIMLGVGGQEPSHAWAAVSWPVARRLEHMFNLPAHAVAHIPNGVDVAPLSPDERRRRQAEARARLGLEPEGALALFLGRLEAAKGADLLPELAAELAPANARIVAAGAGSLRETLEASEAARDGRLRLIGHTRNASDWLFAADLLLAPSRLEGHPLVALEAAARRCPVVATDAALECYGQIRHQIAWIAPVNDVAALAAQARAALADPAAAAGRVEAGYAMARRDDKAAMIAAYKSLLRKIVAHDRLTRAAIWNAPASEARHGA